MTGASGFIGRHCLPLLLAHDYDIHSVSSKPQEASASDITWHQADLLDLQQTDKLVARIKPTHLFHLAWFVPPGKVYYAVENYQWVQASMELLRQFKEHGGQRVLMTGSGAEYDWNYGYCSEYLTPRNPSTFYGQCKNALSTLLDGYSTATGLSSVWPRIFWPYGPYEAVERLTAFVIRSILTGEPANCSHGLQIRDFIHVQDVASALVHLLEADLNGSINVGSGQGVVLKDIIHYIGKQLDGEDLIHLGALPVAEDEPQLVVANVNRLFNEAGWRPKYNLEEGLEQTIGWWKAHLNER